MILQELDELYTDLGNIINEFKNKSQIYIAGDFNAKVGASGNEDCVGKYSSGRRNMSGQNLIEFCTINDLFITNTAFKHPARHITTWCGTRKNNQTNNLLKIFNQIDYIICARKSKNCLDNARSYAGTLTSSDHRLVVTRFNIEKYKLWKTTNNNRKTIINNSALTTEPDIRKKYQQNLHQKLEQLNEENTSWTNIKSAVTEASNEVLKDTSRKQNPRLYEHDIELEEMSKEQKDLRVQIENGCIDSSKVDLLRNRRNQIMHNMRRRKRKVREENLDKQIEEIEKFKDNAKMFEVIKNLRRKSLDNPYIHDAKGRKVTNAKEIHNILYEHFKAKFYQPEEEDIQSFDGPARELNVPITYSEVKISIQKLNNRRAAGKDEINAELIKYGPEILNSKIEKVLNLVFEKHQEIEVGIGLIASIPKPKFKGNPKDLRPVTLLTIIRKILSNIVQKRISPKVNKYLSTSQHAYREGKSTSDIIWCFRWLAAKMQVVKGRIFVTGIDMTSAFDTIKRSNLIEILATFLDVDEIRMIRVLLSNTSLELKMKDTVTKMFKSNIGSPQGDGLSGLLFDVYFENSLRKIRYKMITNNAIIEHSYFKIKQELLPTESIYADDADFMTTDENTNDKLNNMVKDVLLEDNLIVNETKTEHTIIERGKERNTEEWRNVKKLGSLLGDSEDIVRRKQLAIVANKDLNQLWIRKDKLHLSLRLKIYNSLVKPILLYNSGTWGISKNEEGNLNAFHRQQLRYVLKIHHPHHISNANVYKICNEIPLSSSS